MSKYTFNTALLLILLLTCSPAMTEKTITLPDLGRPAKITIDNNQIYIADNEKIHIFNLENFKRVQSFGNKGEGPKEFKFLVNIDINTQTDYIIVESKDKLSFFKKNADFIKEIRIMPGLSKFKPFANGYIATARKINENSQWLSIHFFNEKLQKQNEIYSAISQPKGKKIEFLGRTWNYITDQDKIFISAKDDFVVDVIAKTGKKLFSICRDDYERIKVDSAFEHNFFAWVKKNRPPAMYENMKKMFAFPDYLPAIFDMVIDNDILYIITYKRKNALNEVFLYTTTGKFLKRLDIPLYKDHPIDPLPYTIHDGKIFQLIDNASAEEWELRITPIITKH